MGRKQASDVTAALSNGQDPSSADGAGHSYSITPEQLFGANSEKDQAFVADKGGVEGLSRLLCSDLKHGLTDEQVATSRAVFGANKTKEAAPANFFVLCWETLKDPIIILLIVAAAVSTILGSAIPEERAHNGWIEGVAIWVAVLVVVLVGATNDYQKDRQFRKLNAVKDIIEIKVVRNGEQILIKNHEVVVGDIMLIDTGDKIIADALVVESFGLVIDEASLTGEADPIKKNATDDPWCRSGTQVSEGSARTLVLAVGENSEWGKTMALMGEAGSDSTPLQEKLEVVAAAVGKVGAATAVACFIALMIKWMVENNGFPISKINDNGPVQFFLYAVTIVVVAVPEGLPLAVTISLAYSMKKMMKDNNFVRVLAACETMGGATAICSDKTGTLTENRMTVVEGWVAGAKLSDAPKQSDMPEQVAKDLIANMAINSKAFLIESPDGDKGRIGFVGNRTECALLLLLRDWGVSYNTVREAAHDSGKLEKLFGFSSARKMSSCVVRETRPSGQEVLMVYNKGAAEWVLARCTSYLADPRTGAVQPLTDSMRKELLNTVTAMASRGLRCICLSQAELPVQDPSRPAGYLDEPENVDQNLTAVAIVGIKDPVRKEVPSAVSTCKRAGITVRMVTGDNIHTARHIARECGILDEAEGHLCMEGPDFRNTPEEEMIEKLPQLRVLARSSPEDKLKLVRLIKSQGEVVAVTGDGTNDAPALKESDVGLAMGIAGTEVAKEAADIIILDDNFSSIVKSVLWGRSVFTNIRKFLMFQLTVNFVALVTAFIGAVIGGSRPLNVLQLLWVNLIMDSLGALALATEDPTPELLNLKPHGRTESLITPIMWKHIFTQGLYQLFWMFICLYALPEVIPRYAVTPKAEYYNESCLANTKEEYSLEQSQRFCNIMTKCGYPVGKDLRVTGECKLFDEYWVNKDWPKNEVTAICGDAQFNGKNKCEFFKQFDKARENMADDYEDEKKHDKQRSLSVLFNAFVMMQLFNEINARRINDEYDIFAGIFKSPIFCGVILFTLGLQAIIINFLGTFFKVEALDWKEWLATIAIGLGAIPMSLLVRFISRQMGCKGSGALPTWVEEEHHHPHPRTGDHHNHKNGDVEMAGSPTATQPLSAGRVLSDKQPVAESREAGALAADGAAGVARPPGAAPSTRQPGAAEPSQLPPPV